MKIDCQACKLEEGMEKAKVAKFPLFIQFIGGLIAVPSFLGMAFSGLIIVRAVASPGLESGAFGVGLSVGVALFGMSAVGGLIGWLLVMRKKVFKCSRCGFVLDRA